MKRLPPSLTLTTSSKLLNKTAQRGFQRFIYKEKPYKIYKGEGETVYLPSLGVCIVVEHLGQRIILVNCGYCRRQLQPVQGQVLYCLRIGTGLGVAFEAGGAALNTEISHISGRRQRFGRLIPRGPCWRRGRGRTARGLAEISSRGHFWLGNNGYGIRWRRLQKLKNGNGQEKPLFRTGPFLEKENGD